MHEDLFEIDDEKEFMKAALRVWRARHPKRPRKNPGPSPLPSIDVCEATATVLEGLTPDSFNTLPWKQLIFDVQKEVEKRRGKQYSAATIRRHVRDYMYEVLFWHDIPPKLLDHRQPWMKGGAKALAKRVAAFYRYRAIPPKKKT